jgi:hypothetical protein
MSGGLPQSKHMLAPSPQKAVVLTNDSDGVRRQVLLLHINEDVSEAPDAYPSQACGFLNFH